MTAIKKQKIVFASLNQGKILELRDFLKDQPFELILQHDLNIPEIEETGLTFVENALIKARHASEKSGLSAIADDSGLVIDALSGAPGIYSARYAGKKASSRANIEKVLQALKNTPLSNRRAHFHCTLLYLSHPDDPAPIICEGQWHGHILQQPAGKDGFGYDPIFFVEDKQCSAAELPLNEKNQISHRGKALKKLVEQLETLCRHS